MCFPNASQTSQTCTCATCFRARPAPAVSGLFARAHDASLRHPRRARHPGRAPTPGKRARRRHGRLHDSRASVGGAGPGRPARSSGIFAQPAMTPPALIRMCGRRLASAVAAGSSFRSNRQAGARSSRTSPSACISFTPTWRWRSARPPSPALSWRSMQRSSQAGGSPMRPAFPFRAPSRPRQLRDCTPRDLPARDRHAACAAGCAGGPAAQRHKDHPAQIERAARSPAPGLVRCASATPPDCRWRRRCAARPD